MGFWENVQEKLSNALKEIKKNPYLDAVAVSAIESVPLIGGLLVKLYENAPGEDEDKTSEIITLLTHLEKLDPESLEEICRGIDANKNLLVSANDSLSNLTNEISSIHQKLDEQKGDVIDIKIGQTEIHLDVLKLRKHQEKILDAVNQVKDKVDLLYEHITKNSRPEIAEEDSGIVKGSGYKIFCPDDWEVVSEEETQKLSQKIKEFAEQSPIPIDERDTSKTDLMIRYKDSIEKFQPNVNIVIGNVIHKNFIMQVGATNMVLFTLGGFIVNQTIDQMANIATVELLVKTAKREQYMIQKHYVRQDKHYILTIPDLRDSQLQKHPKILEDLKNIVQSFTFV